MIVTFLFSLLLIYAIYHKNVAMNTGTSSCLIPDYAIGIRSHRAHPSDAFAQPRCFANAIHGAKEGAWELRSIAPGDAVPSGWRRVGPTLIEYTYWERITP